MCTYNDNLKISSKHARIFLVSDKLEFYTVCIEDLSANGVYINGKLVGNGNKVRLNNNDVITLVYSTMENKKADKTVGYKFVSLLDRWLPNWEYTASTSVQTPNLSQTTHSPVSSSTKKSLAVKMHGISTKKPEHFINSLKISPLPHILEQLCISLQTHGEDWMSDFIDLGGLFLVQDILFLKARKTR